MGPSLFLLGLVAAQAADSALQRVVDSVRAELNVPGVSVTVITAGGTWTGTSGLADASTRVTAETVFEIGSITKTFTGALAVRLWESGTLALDDTVSRWLPDLPEADRMTVRQLLRHTSGLYDAFTDSAFMPAILRAPWRAWTAAEVLAIGGAADFPPGGGWHYSSSGYVAAGAIMERVTGRPLPELLREHFVIPLGLSRTYYGAHDAVPAPRAHGYYDVNDDGRLDDLSLLMPSTALLSAAGPAGAVLASSPDLAVWLRALVSGRVLSDSGRSALLEFVDRPDGHHYGLGVLRVVLDGVVLLGHRGNTAGFSAAAWHAPDANITVVVLTNAPGIQVTPFVRALLRLLAA